MAKSRKEPPPPVLLVVAVAAAVFLCSCPAAVSARKVGETCALDRNCDAGLHCETCVADGNVRPRCTRVTPVDPQSKAADLPFNRYSWLTTHNSFARLGARSQTGTAIATAWNQQDTVTQQLNNGVRGLMLDMYDFRNDIWLCHSYGQGRPYGGSGCAAAPGPKNPGAPAQGRSYRRRPARLHSSVIPRRHHARCSPSTQPHSPWPDSLDDVNTDVHTLSRICVAMSSRTYESGAAKRKSAKRVDDLIKSQKGDIYKFFKSNAGFLINSSDELAIVTVEEEQQANENSESGQQEENIDTNIGDSNTPAVNVLREIEVFLTRNPSEVITIFIEDYVESPMGLTRVFNASGLTPYLFPAWHMPKNGGDWPLLSDMVRDSHRLVVFTSKAAKEQAEGFAHEWRYVVENQYGTKGMVSGSCPKRAESAAMNDLSRSLVLVNYFRDLPNLPEACKDNSARLLGMLDTCHAASGDRWANFIAVDFYKRSDRGGAAEATDKANGGLVCGCGSIAACNSNGTCLAHKRGATPKGIFNATSDAAVWRPPAKMRQQLLMPTALIALLLWL